jgi:hypothetical protein
MGQPGRTHQLPPQTHDAARHAQVMGTAHHNLPERRFMIVTTLIGHDGG